MVVLPVPRDSVVMMSESNNNTVDFASIPKLNCQPVINEIIATAGIVSPILANAEPSARLILVCRRLDRAAIIAVMIPTNSLGAPTAATADSRLGASDLASKTTATRQTINNPALHQATLFDGFGACTPSSLTATSGKK